MRANGTFSVKASNPAAVTAEPAISTALPVGVATMEKSFDGDIADRPATLFTVAFDQATGWRHTWRWSHSRARSAGWPSAGPDGTHRIWPEYQIGG